jgi:hypothetical protein
MVLPSAITFLGNFIQVQEKIRRSVAKTIFQVVPVAPPH